MVAATDLPVNADFETATRSMQRRGGQRAPGVETGVPGCRSKDSTGDSSDPLFSIDTAVERIRAARKAIDKSAATRC